MKHIKLFEQHSQNSEPETYEELIKLLPELKTWYKDLNIGGYTKIIQTSVGPLDLYLRYKDEAEEMYTTQLAVFLKH